MDFNKAPLNTEIEINEGKFKYVSLTYNPTKENFSGILYFEESKELHPVKPSKITGQVKTWKTKSEMISNLKKYIKELKNER